MRWEVALESRLEVGMVFFEVCAKASTDDNNIGLHDRYQHQEAAAYTIGDLPPMTGTHDITGKSAVDFGDCSSRSK